MLRWAFYSLLSLFMFATPSLAHEVEPANVDIDLSKPGIIEIAIGVDLEALMAITIGVKETAAPGLPETYTSIYEAEYTRLKKLTASQLENEFKDFANDFLAGFSLSSERGEIVALIKGTKIPDPANMDQFRQSTIFLSANIPPDATNIIWEWSPNFGPSVVRIAEDNENKAYSAYLLEGQKSDPIAINGERQRSLVQTILNYIGIGYIHILPRGVDHILFVVGLFLLSARMHALIWQISAFTLAHTITLALGMSGVVSVSAAIVEPLIALSIVYVCVENILTQKLTRWRPMVVFGFGLLHGLGFAGVLKEIGLPSNEFVAGLISFNIGVELGQLSIIAICFLLVGFWFSKKPWYRAYIVIPASIAIGSIGGWWFFERVFIT